MPLALEFAIAHRFYRVLADSNNALQLSSASVFQEELKNKQTEDEQVSKETMLVEGIV